MRFYTGSADREVSQENLDRFTAFAKRLSKLGFIARLGGETNVSKAFEEGAGFRCSVYLPWTNFNNHPSQHNRISRQAYCIAEQNWYRLGVNEEGNNVEINWSHLKTPTRKIMARTSYMILGDNLNDPSSFMITCFEKDPTGDTAQLCRLAKKAGVKIYNLANAKDGKDLDKYLQSLEYPNETSLGLATNDARLPLLEG